MTCCRLGAGRTSRMVAAAADIAIRRLPWQGGNGSPRSRWPFGVSARRRVATRGRPTAIHRRTMPTSAASGVISSARPTRSSQTSSWRFSMSGDRILSDSLRNRSGLSSATPLLAQLSAPIPGRRLPECGGETRGEVPFPQGHQSPHLQVIAHPRREHRGAAGSAPRASVAGSW